MSRDFVNQEPALSRRALLNAMGGALGCVALGVEGAARAGIRHPQRGGVLRFATRSDTLGLDPHRYLYHPVSVPLAATMQGLVDLDLHSEPVPGVAEEWYASRDLLTYTFKLRRGVRFHNGREVNAEAVKWNFKRMQMPQIANSFIYSALLNLKAVEVLDRYTVRFRLHQPSAAFPAHVVYYPCSLISPDSFTPAQPYPVGCGPFRFERWERGHITEVKRFEDYYETDSAGNNLPYLDGILGQPRYVEQVRFMRLRSGQADLIETATNLDTRTYTEYYAKEFQLWNVPTLGTSYILFNLDTGPFTDRRLRQAAAHAIDHEMLKRVVFYSRGESARGFYPSISPWHALGTRPWPEYDPDRAKFLLRQAKSEGVTIVLQSLRTSSYMKQTAALIQGMWSEVGFNVLHQMYDAAVLTRKRRTRAFHAESTAASYRFDPDGWFSRYLLSTAMSTRESSGFRDHQVDRLIHDARKTPDRQKRLQLYAEIDSVINEELPILYLHHLTSFEMGVMHLKGYQPAISGLFSTRGGGIRTAWLAEPGVLP